MVSPWIAKNTVVNAPSPAQAPTSTSQWDATSIISSANKIFGITGESMTKRDAWAATFVDLVDGSSPMRSDCPLTLPKVKPVAPHVLAAEMTQPLNDHHLDSLNLLCHLSDHAHPVCTGFVKGEEARKAYVAELATSSRGAHLIDQQLPWDMAEDYPHLHPTVAPLLQQQHFETVSKSMWTVYKTNAMAAGASSFSSSSSVLRGVAAAAAAVA